MYEKDRAPILHMQCENMGKGHGRTGAADLEVLRELNEPLIKALLEEGGLGVAAVRGWWVDGVNCLYDVAQDSG